MMKLSYTKMGVFLALAAVAAWSAPVIVGQYPYWAQYSQYFAKDVRFELMTHVSYGYFSVSPEGELQLQDGSDQPNFEALVKAAKEKNVKVVVSLGGPGAAEGLRAATDSPEKRGILAKNVARLLQEHGLSGIELDWSFPEEADADAFHATVEVLAEAVKPAGKTLAVTIPWDEQRGAYLKPAVLNQADFVVVQTLEMAGESATVLPNADVVKSLAALDRIAASGVEKSKILAVAPMYARSYVGAAGLGESHQGPGSGNEGILLWSDLMDRFNGTDYKTTFDEATLSEYAVGRGETIVFNGIASLKAFSEAIKQAGYAGLVGADLSCDHRQAVVSLMVTLNKGLK